MASYHTWHHPDLDGKPAFSTASIDVPAIPSDPDAPPAGLSETKQLASLMNDMDELRKIGQTKGICDAQRDVGKSHLGKELWLLKIGKGDHQKVLFTGCHHAREWISVEVSFLVARYLIENYKAKPANEKQQRIKHLVDNRQIWVIPLTNPDGHTFTQTDDRRWRPNLRPVVFDKDVELKDVKNIDTGSSRTIRIKKGTYTGVDINRNYPESQWGLETSGTSRDPTRAGPNSTWCGPSKGSEPETDRIVKLFDANSFRANLTLHSAGQLLIYVDETEKDRFTQFVGKGMSELIKEKDNPYDYIPSRMLYRSTGNQRAFSWERTKRPSFTVELRPNDAHREWYFSALPEDQIEPTFREVLPACLALINCAGLDQIADRAKVTVSASDPVAQVVRNGWKVFHKWEP